MDEPSNEPRQSRVWRTIRYFDPAESGFLGRMLRLGLVLGAFVACALVAVGLVSARSEFGRYSIAYGLSSIHQHEEALKWSEELVEDFPGKKWEYYRLTAFNLRHLDRIDESLAVYDEAIEALPDVWWPHSHRCFYNSLLADPAVVLDSCDKSVELGPGNPEVALERRAIARGLTGDLEGAAQDLEAAIEAYEVSGSYTWELDVRKAWLETLQEGGNPFTPEALEQELENY